MILFLLKASLVLAVLLCFYKLFLEKETFFSTNRYYLIGCLILSFSLPMIVIPEMINNQGIVSTVIESAIDQQEEKVSLPLQTISTQNSTEISTSTKSETPSKQTTKETKTTDSEPTVSNGSSQNVKGIGFWVIMVYLFGVIVLALNLIAQVLNTLWKALRAEDKISSESGTIVNLNGVIEPCSFFKYIFINPATYDYDTYEQILEHEKVHVQRMHSLDLLLSELAVVFLWFNPFSWILRKEVEKNIEFETDHILVTQRDVEKQNYQLNLVKIACTKKPLSITTNYNQSLIKQRIMKMNIKKIKPIWVVEVFLPVTYCFCSLIGFKQT